MHREFSIRSDLVGETHRLVPCGELDLATAPGLEQELRRVEASGARAIVLDLSELDFISSTGLTLIVEAQQRSRTNSGRLRLVRPPPQVLRAFEISGLSERLAFSDA